MPFYYDGLHYVPSLGLVISVLNNFIVLLLSLSQEKINLTDEKRYFESTSVLLLSLLFSSTAIDRQKQTYELTTEEDICLSIIELYFTYQVLDAT